jgi:hypothetical protein
MLGEHIGRYPSPDGWVFTAAEGGPVHHHNFRRRQYTPAVESAELLGVRFHDLRHTCAALLIAAGRHLEEVKTYLGHSSIRVTSDRYGHLFPEAQPQHRNQRDGLIDRKPQPEDGRTFSRPPAGTLDATKPSQRRAPDPPSRHYALLARAASMISGRPRRQVTLRLTRTSFQLPRSRTSRFR